MSDEAIIIFKPTYTDKKTKQIVESRFWYCRIGGKRYPLRTKDKRVAEQRARDMKRQHADGDDPEQIMAARREPIENHLASFELSLKAKECGVNHISLVMARLRRVFAACGIQKLADVRVLKIEEWLVKQQVEIGMSAQTRRHYAVSLKQLGTFLMSLGLVGKSPFAPLQTALNIEADRRLLRRCLTPDELRKLLDSVRNSNQKRCKMRGPQRRLLYWVAAVTGLRKSELGSLTKESFLLDAEPPTVTVVAKRTKNRKIAILPLRSDLVAELRPWLVKKKPEMLLFPIEGRPTNLLLRSDLKDAGIEWKVLGRQCDFHALRVTMISHLAISGVPLAIAQKLARHSTPVLTSNIYTSLNLGDLKNAVESLPSMNGERAGSSYKPFTPESQ